MGADADGKLHAGVTAAPQQSPLVNREGTNSSLQASQRPVPILEVLVSPKVLVSPSIAPGPGLCRHHPGFRAVIHAEAYE
jgi:hypothetical protein